MKPAKKIFFVIVAMILAMTIAAQTNNPGVKSISSAPDWNWVQTFGGSGGITGTDIVSDASGNYFLTGYFNGHVTFSSGDISSTGIWDLFIAKYDGSGNILWIKTIAAAPYEKIKGNSIALDNNGNILVAGVFTGTVIIGSQTLVSFGKNDCFIAKFDNSGNPMWATAYWDANDETLTDMTTDSTGNVYALILSDYSDSLTEKVLIKCTSSGSIIWVMWMIGTSKINSIVYSDSALYLTGEILNQATFGSTTLSSGSYPSSFLAKCTCKLFFNFEWASNVTSNTGYSSGQSLVLDNAGNIYTCGYFSDTVHFNTPGINLYSSHTPYYLAKYNSTGNCLWAGQFTDNIITPVSSSWIRLDTASNPCFFGYSDTPCMIGSTLINGGNFFTITDTSGNIQSTVQQTYQTNCSVIDPLNKIVQASSKYINDLCLIKQDLSGNTAWIKTTETNCGTADTWYHIAVDPHGYSYLHGHLHGKNNFLGTSVTGEGAYMARITGDKKLRWIRVFQAKNNQADPVAVAADANGNSYGFGFFLDTISVESTVLTNPYGGEAAYLIKYDKDGLLQWARTFQCTRNFFHVGAVAVNADGSVLIGNSFMDTLYIGSSTLISNGNSDLYFAKFSGDGSFLFAKSFGSTSTDYCRSLAVDGQKNILITGPFRNTVNFGNTTLTSFGGYDVYVAKYDPDGNALWAVQAGSANSERGFAVATDLAGNAYVSGFFLGTQMTFGSITLTVPVNSYTIYFAKYSSGGTPLWARYTRAPFFAWPSYQIGVDEEGSCYVGGSYQDSLLFQNGITLKGGINNNFLAKYSTAGDYLWSKNITGNNGASGLFGIAVFNKNSILAGGRIYDDSMDFDPIKISCANYNAFLALLGDNLPAGINPVPGYEEGPTVYPNPSHHNLNIKLSYKGNQKIIYSLMNENGKDILKDLAYGNDVIRINLPDLPEGLYLLKIWSNGKLYTEKIIISR